MSRRASRSGPGSSRTQRLPWLAAERHARIQRIREYIRLGYSARHMVVHRPTGLKDLARRALQAAARWRLRRLFVRFPADAPSPDGRLVAFVRNDNLWVRFTVKDREGQEFTIEKKIVRTAKIKQRNRMLEQRPVVLLGICIGRQYREVEVNLVDRTDFIYPLLFG